jgi:hypothetical protein
VGGTSGTHGGRRGKCTRFCWDSQKEGDHLQDQDVDGDEIRMDFREIGWGCRLDLVGSG